MLANARLSWLFSLKFQVLATWLWNSIGAVLVAAIAAGLTGRLGIARDAMRANPTLTWIPIAGEVVAVGLLPVLFALFNRDKLSTYGVQRAGVAASMLWSAAVVAAAFGLSLFTLPTLAGATLAAASPLNVLCAACDRLWAAGGFLRALADREHRPHRQERGCLVVPRPDRDGGDLWRPARHFAGPARPGDRGRLSGVWPDLQTHEECDWPDVRLGADE